MRDRSIRFRLAVSFSLILTVLLAAAFLTLRLTSGAVLQGTIREYLVSTVEQNAAQIVGVTEREEHSTDLYLPFQDMFLVIDQDFMDVVNGVYTALYTADGALLYGENPLSRQTAVIPFTENRTFALQTGGQHFDLCDRRVELSEGKPALWVRGVVPETESVQQLQRITRLSLLILPLLLGLALVIAYAVIDRTLSPLCRFEETAEQISQGDDLKRRIDMDGREDELGRLARVFNRMFDRLEQAFETERRFTADASHELRTPAAVILAQTEYTLERERSAAEYREALETVHKQGRRMSALIDDMLAYTRLEQSPGRYPFTAVDLTRLTRETAEDFALLESRGITLRCEAEERIFLSGNAMLLSRMLQNLLSNALRYGKENGEVLVRLQHAGEGAELSVRDDGPGIPPEEREKIFERFYRMDASRAVQGTGLGLPMVRRIAQMHGAAVELESETGRGSCFRIVFPKVRKN